MTSTFVQTLFPNLVSQRCQALSQQALMELLLGAQPTGTWSRAKREGDNIPTTGLKMLPSTGVQSIVQAGWKSHETFMGVQEVKIILSAFALTVTSIGG